MTADSEPAVSRPDLAAARRHLRADCSRCVGLCCVAPAFARSADFAFDKPAGQPCRHLRADSGCGIHERLRGQGFAGCSVFDCFGAGQQVVQVTFGGADWRDGDAVAAAMFTVFTVLRQVHEVQWYLLEARALVAAGPLSQDVEAALTRNLALIAGAADALAQVDTAGYRRQVGRLLERVSERVRSAVVGRADDHRDADLMGAKLRGADLRGASLRGAYLIGADLRDADLRRVDLLGADLRAADLRGARLDDALFVTQPQLEAARGDGATTLPASLRRPGHW